MKKICVAVSGINAVDNPGPGIGVIRSLKEDSNLEIEAIGLAYDAMEPGIYMDWLVDKVFVLPYPSGDKEGFLSRLLYIKKMTDINIIIPTLDAEMPIYIKTADYLESVGIKTFLPTKSQFELRDKTKLTEVANKIDLKIPRTKTVTSYEDLVTALNDIGLPVMVKGLYYKAYQAYTYQEATGYFNKIVAEWGYPVIIQQVVKGEEMNVIGIGDGTGGHLGLVAIKKLWITSLGKIWTGVTVKNELLLEAASKFVKEFKWRGAFELECIVSKDDMYLIEINPRFPAWVYFATGVGINLPARLLKAALGLPVEDKNEYSAGKLYIRYTYDIVTDMSIFQRVVTRGER